MHLSVVDWTLYLTWSIIVYKKKTVYVLEVIKQDKVEICNGFGPTFQHLSRIIHAGRIHNFRLSWNLNIFLEDVEQVNHMCNIVVTNCNNCKIIVTK